MAPGESHPRCSSHRNLSSIDPLENELARDSGSVGSPHSGSTSPTPSRNPTPDLKLVSALIPALIPTPTPPSSDKLFNQIMKAYLKLSQGSSRPPAERERFFKAKMPDVYYGKLHMDCYHFCQLSKDHFETVGATGANRTLFAASFLCENISVHSTQYKRRHRGEKLTPITWTEFKAFVQKNLVESKLFIDSIWEKLKRDLQYQLEEVYNWASPLSISSPF